MLRNIYTTVILEPLNKRESNRISYGAEWPGLQICDRMGLRCNGDFWHMTSEEISDLNALNLVRVFKPHSYCQPENPLSAGTDGTSDNYIEGLKD